MGGGRVNIKLYGPLPGNSRAGNSESNRCAEHTCTFFFFVCRKVSFLVILWGMFGGDGRLKVLSVRLLVLRGV